MTESARSVVLDYLIATGWRHKAEGPSGELWARGSNETVLPRRLEVDSPPWNRLAQALALADKEPVEEILTEWRRAVKEAEEIAVSSQVRVREAPGRVELDVHLSGHGVRQNETRAYEFGTFVMRAAESVKELVKSARGTRHHARNLVVVGGPLPGSVRVVLREPDYSDSTALITDAPETVEGVALVYLAGVFAAANDAVSSPDTEQLVAQLSPLSVRARLSVARLADTVREAGWNVSGTIRRGSQEAPIHLAVAGADLLSRASREGIESEETIPVVGTLDGWVWSRSELTMQTESRGLIRVSVPMSLQVRVGELHASPNTEVIARVAMFTRRVLGTGAALQTSFSLVSIQPAKGPTLV
ncbi:hypothetical protein GA707_14935 [Nostocoides sp. F2B08]|uniref:hypothetical protein n=1 Tax=Nostocoides sp. F2B08 TaxID=2653936 RepID=UPI001263C3D6|nr:hypothetical protein [Tetrasphaera sp. F2B08]KAB7742948.1 hypothetical protein GA707_14935 [Tetrasphaera sp. F2B08]